jgi:predicted amidohydrolase
MSSSLLNIGLVQFDIAWEDPTANFQRIEDLLQHQPKFDLLLLPEMWSTGFTMQPETAAELPQGPACQWMISMSQTLNTAIIGSIAVREGIRFYNRLYCAFPDGQLESYDKKHLFSYGKEDRHYTPGLTQTLINIKGWRIRPIICYDLRFPVWCRNTNEYDVMIVVANWPVPRIPHWDALLRARAIENQSFVAAVNRIGSDDNGLVYNGHSSLYDMNGSLLLSMDEKEGIGRIELDKDTLTTYREHFRFLQDRDTFTL